MLVDCAAYRDGERVTSSLDLAEVGDWLCEPNTLTWIGLRMPSHDELSDVFTRFGIDELEVDEVLAPHDRPVFTRDDDLTTLVLRTARYEESTEEFALGELSVLLGANFVITVRHGRASPLSGLRDELEQEPDNLRLGPPEVLARIITQVIDDYLPALDDFERDVMEVGAAVFDGTRIQPVERIYRLQSQIRRLLVAIDALHDPLARLVRTNRAYWDEEVLTEMHEAVEQLARAVARTRSLSELLTSALDANLAQVSLRQNEDMRKISAWVAIAAVPTMLAGLYGMNFDTMPELRWDFGYPLVLAVMAIICALLHRNFRRSGWL